MLSSISNFKEVKGLVAALASKKAIQKAGKATSSAIADEIKYLSENLSQEEIEEVSNAADKGLKTSGLYDKGVRIYKFDEIKYSPDLKVIKYNEKDEEALNAVKKEILAGKSRFYYNQDNLKSRINLEADARIYAETVKLGYNAMYLAKTQAIFAPNKSHQPSLFHEMGHAANRESAPLEVCRVLRGLDKVVAPVVTGAIILNNPSDKKSKKQKTFNFIENNAGKIVAISYMPTILEEAYASKSGLKIAKKLNESGDLSDKLYKTTKKTCDLGMGSYVVFALSNVLSIKAMSKVKKALKKK